MGKVPMAVIRILLYRVCYKINKSKASNSWLLKLVTLTIYSNKNKKHFIDGSLPIRISVLSRIVYPASTTIHVICL